MNQALYRKYRSLKLEDVLGQDHVTTILTRAINKGRIAHAYLLSGPRGTGKTSVARILAHQINNLPYTKESNHIDIIEIDAASNNGIDNIRDLREKSRIAPVTASYKVYIIDEVHMLSKSAFNALLKTLEEPPAHVVFIMATTDPEKIPATILSRVQQYHFHPISSKVIAKHLIHIAKQEGYTLTAEAAAMIAERSRGGFRDSISLLDQLLSLADKDTPLDEGLIVTSLGLPQKELIETLLDAYLAQDSDAVLSGLRNAHDAGISTHTLIDQLLIHGRERLASTPSFIELLSVLVDIPGHAHADIKLLGALMPKQAKAKPPKPVTAPLKATQPAPITLEAPTKPTPSKKDSKPSPIKSTKEQTVTTTEPATTIKKTKDSGTLETFDWNKLTQDAKEQSIGLYSLLAKCGTDIDGTKLIIYSGTGFTKKKLEDGKNLQIITSIVCGEYGDNIEIEIRSGRKPPADDKLAAVASIMGGGEEVNLEEIV